MTELESGEVELRSDGSSFDAFVEAQGPRLRRALVAANGVQIGNDACADALAWAWEHRSNVMAMEHPVAYLYRVGQSAARRHRRWRQELDFPPEERVAESAPGAPGLDEALQRLNRQQRTVVILVHAHGWSYDEVAESLGLSPASVRNHLHRAMKRLRQEMERS